MDFSKDFAEIYFRVSKILSEKKTKQNSKEKYSKRLIFVKKEKFANLRTLLALFFLIFPMNPSLTEKAISLKKLDAKYSRSCLALALEL